jgi:hypothetical protein
MDGVTASAQIESLIWVIALEERGRLWLVERRRVRRVVASCRLP